MLKLDDIRKSVAWQEALAEGRAEGREEGQLLVKQELAKKLLADGKSLKQIAEFLSVSIPEARKWTNN